MAQLVKGLRGCRQSIRRRRARILILERVHGDRAGDEGSARSLVGCGSPNWPRRPRGQSVAVDGRGGRFLLLWIIVFARGSIFVSIGNKAT